MRLRVENEYPWSNMFAYNMFIHPSEDQFEGFDPECTVINVPGLIADPD